MNKQKERARKNTCVNKNGKHSHEVRFMLSRIARREEKEERGAEDRWQADIKIENVKLWKKKNELLMFFNSVH